MTHTPALTVERYGPTDPDLFTVTTATGRSFAATAGRAARLIRAEAPWLTDHQLAEILADIADPAAGLAAVTFGLAS